MDIPNNLLQSVKEGRVVLVLGAGASNPASTSEGSKAPSGKELAEMIGTKFLGGEHSNSPLPIVSELAMSESSVPEVQQYIHDVFQDIQPASFHALLPTFKWAGLATTNFDLVIERAYSTYPNPSQELVPLIKNGDQIEEKLRSPRSLRLLKLHGCITRTTDESLPLILSVDQYVTHRRGRDRLFGQLKDLSYEHPLVFIGQSLQDPDIRQFLFDLGEPSQRPRYFTVTPELSGPEKRFWEGKRITPLEGTFEEFLRTLDRELPSVFRGVVPSPVAADLPISERFVVKDPGLSASCLEFLESDVDFIYNAMPTEALDAKLFYRGYNPRWAAVGQGLDVKRELQDTILTDTILQDVEGARCRLFVIKGHAGSGKSVLLQRIAWEAALTFNSLCLFLQKSGQLSPEALRELSGVVNERIYLFVDDIGEHTAQVLDVIKAARRYTIPLTVIGAERVNEWNMSCEELEPYLDYEFEVGYLTGKEIDGLLELLSSHRALFRLENVSQSERKTAFVEKAGRQLLVALHEATLGKPFEDIIADEYAEVSPILAQLIYLGVCFLNRYDVPVRAGIVNRVYGVGFNQFAERFFQPLDALVFSRFDRRIGDYVYVTRHPHVADIVVARAMTTPEERLDLHLTILNAMNIDYESDRKAFRKLVRARSLLEDFRDNRMVDEIFAAARKNAGEYPYLFHQMAIFEMVRPNGSLKKAEEHLTRARTLAPYDRTIAHSFAELHLRRADGAKTSLEFQSSLRAARELAMPLAGPAAVDSHGLHTLAKIQLANLRRFFHDEENDWNDLEFRNVVKEIEGLIQEGLQRFPGDSYMLDAESQLGDLLADEARAITALEAAFDNNPNSQFVAVRLAKMLEGSGKVPESVNVYKRAIQSGVTDKRVHFNYAKLLIDQDAGDDGDIEYHLRRAFTEGDSNIEAQFWYARQLYVNGDIDEARNRFRRLRDLPFNPNIKRAIRGPISAKEGPQQFAGRIDRLEYDYGFVIRDGTADGVFFHSRNDVQGVFGNLKVNARVIFSIGFNFWGATAIDVSLE